MICYNCKTRMELIEKQKDVLLNGNIYYADIIGCPECGIKVYNNLSIFKLNKIDSRCIVNNTDVVFS